MTVAYVVVAVMTIVVNAGAAIADFTRAKFVLANSGELGLPPRFVLPLGILKALGAAGLLLGLLGVQAVGTAAAIGLVLFFVGAVGIHVTKGVFHNIAVPGAYLALAVCTLVLDLAP